MKTGWRKDAFHSAAERFSAGRFGMWLFLASLAMLFAASLVGFLVVRLISDAWPDDLPALPGMLWVSTGVLVISSLTMQGALHSARTDGRTSTGPLLLATTILGFVFLILQAWCWLTWLGSVENLWDRSDEFRFALTSFQVLTGIHAAHVLGGLVPLCVVTRRGLAGRYDSHAYDGVQFCATYWHFLGGVWLVLYATLLIGL